MSKKMEMTGPGRVVNRAAKHGKIDLAVDPSPGGFLSDARQQKERIKVLVIPGDGDTDPIEIYAHPKSLVLRCEGAMIPPGRLADLEALITEEEDVHVVIEYVPKQDQLPFTDAPKDRTTESTETDREIIPLKFKGLRGCFCQLTVVHDADGWRAGYEIKVGNLERSTKPEDQITRASRAEAIQVAKSSLEQWAEEVEVSGSADARRAMTRRLTSVCEQIEEQLDPMINAAEEFAEDEPHEEEEPGLNADEDQDQ